MTNKKLCADNLKYGLMNVIRPAFDKGEYIRRRQLSYKNMYQLHSENVELDRPCKHLYALLYSKYYTERYILQETKGIVFDKEDDEQTKRRFEGMLRDAYNGKIEFDNRYLSIVKDFQKPENFEEFKALHGRIDGFIKMTEDEKELFFVGSSNTDVFLEKKLSKDVDLFKSRTEKTLSFLDKYKFVNGWLTAAGIWSFNGWVTAAGSWIAGLFSRWF